MTQRQYKKVKDGVYTAEKNFVPQAKEFFLAVAVSNEGNEGVIAKIDLGRFPPVEKPLMGATEEDRKAIFESAKEAAKQSGLVVRILKYTQCEVIETFYPDGMN